MSESLLRPLDDEVHVWRLPRMSSRTVVTRILSRYLGVEPCAVHVRRDERGKPGLGSEYDSTLRFNLSHGGRYTLVAIAAGNEVGIDVEPYRSMAGGWALTRAALTVGEQQRLAAEDLEDQSLAFLRIWVRKEAILKAAGMGLHVEPSSLDLRGTQIVSVPTALGEPGSWRVEDLSLTGHVGAIAIEGSTRPRVRLFA